MALNAITAIVGIVSLNWQIAGTNKLLLKKTYHTGINTIVNFFKPTKPNIT